MSIILGLCEHCLSPLSVIGDYETDFELLPNVCAYLLRCPECGKEYVYFEDKEEN